MPVTDKNGLIYKIIAVTDAMKPESSYVAMQVSIYVMRKEDGNAQELINSFLDQTKGWRNFLNFDKGNSTGSFHGNRNKKEYTILITQKYGHDEELSCLLPFISALGKMTPPILKEEDTKTLTEEAEKKLEEVNKFINNPPVLEPTSNTRKKDTKEAQPPPTILTTARTRPKKEPTDGSPTPPPPPL